MERENKKVSIVYILTGIVILLIVYLALFIYKTFNPEEEPNIYNSNIVKTPQVASSCTFYMTVSEFNNISSNTNLCNSLNQINLTDVILNEKKLNVVVYYSNIYTNDISIYINEERALSDNVLKVHKMGIFDNKLFITDFSDMEANFVAYDENGINVYSLKDALNSFQIADPAFTLMNITNKTLNVNNLDVNSFVFENGKVSFNSTAKTCVNGVSGSSYSIVYTGSAFGAPTYIANVTC